MEFITSGFVEENLPYLSLVMAVVACLLLYLGMGHQIQRLRYAMALHRQRVESLENQLLMLWGGGAEARGGLTTDSTKQRVLHLHGLGRSSKEIAQEAGIREAEVDFVLKVNEHLASPGRTLALRKIS
jgi:hypothetical protein